MSAGQWWKKEESPKGVRSKSSSSSARLRRLPRACRGGYTCTLMCTSEYVVHRFAQVILGSTDASTCTHVIVSFER